MPVTVSDSSTLIHLAGIGRLELLRACYGRVLVPAAVFREVVEEGGSRPAARLVAGAVAAGWIEVAAGLLPEAADLQRDGRLHAGEAEAMALARQHGADALLLMDEAHGRSVARARRQAVTGLLGVLLRAKQEGLIPSVRAELDRLRNESGFHLHEQLIRQVLRQAGEE